MSRENLPKGAKSAREGHHPSGAGRKVAPGANLAILGVLPDPIDRARAEHKAREKRPRRRGYAG